MDSNLVEFLGLNLESISTFIISLPVARCPNIGRIAGFDIVKSGILISGKHFRRLEADFAALADTRREFIFVFRELEQSSVQKDKFVDLLLSHVRGRFGARLDG
jgi:hypothetical protein